jgi:hypothetical protein
VGSRKLALGVVALVAQLRKFCDRCPFYPFLPVAHARVSDQREDGPRGKAYLVARVHVDSSPKAVIHSSILRIILCRRYCQPVTRTSQSQSSFLPMRTLLISLSSACRYCCLLDKHSCSRLRRTHPFEAIVTIWPEMRLGDARWRSWKKN